MAFCNSCGATLESGARFCPKCGRSQPATAAASVAAAPTPAASPQGTSGVKIILIVVAVIVGLGILGVGTIAIVGWRIARHTHIQSRDGNVRVQSPFGTVESTNDPARAAQDLGIDLYPNARVLKENAANISVAGMNTVAAEFESDDPVEKVAAFYKAKFPNANVSVSDQNHYTIVSTEGNLITIDIEPQGDKTHIHVAKVGGKGTTGGDNN